MRSRAVILPDCGDPYIALFWLDLFHTRWKNDVDRLYFDLNSPVEVEIHDAIRNEVAKDSRSVFTSSGEMISHGASIKKTLANVKESHVVLMENDAVVFKSGPVDAAFSLIEKDECDIVASDRSPASMKLAAATRKKFGIGPERHPFFWPCYFFAETRRLLRNDQTYWYKVWEPGEYISQIDWVTEADDGDPLGNVRCDTFVWASIQIRSELPRVHFVDQYHADCNDFDQRDKKQNIWSEEAGWLHYGSVSSGYFQLLRDRRNVPLLFRNKPNWQSHIHIPWYIQRGECECERRASWWKMCYLTQKHKLAHIPGLNAAYEDAINHYVETFGFNEKTVDERMAIYRELLRV